MLSGWYFRDYFDQPSRATIGTVVAILEVGAFVSSLLVGRIGDLIGRRRTILYGSLVFFIGGAFQTFATNMTLMMIGRIIAGLGVGALSTIVPVYQSEISVRSLHCTRRSTGGELHAAYRSYHLTRHMYANTRCLASPQSRQAGLHRILWKYLRVCD